MRVQFDLRPAEYLERERKRHSFNFVRLEIRIAHLPTQIS